MSTSGHPKERKRRGIRRADPMGAYVTTFGVLLFVLSTFVDWIQTDDESFTGYQADTVVAYTAYLGIGFAAALLYAARRADRRQHRGLSLSSMAAGVAAAGLSLSYMFEVPGGAERKAGFDTDLGVVLGLLGALVWTVGSYLHAGDPEGDIEYHDDRRVDDTRPAGRGTSTDGT